MPQLKTGGSPHSGTDSTGSQSRKAATSSSPARLLTRSEVASLQADKRRVCDGVQGLIDRDRNRRLPQAA